MRPPGLVFDGELAQLAQIARQATPAGTRDPREVVRGCSPRAGPPAQPPQRARVPGQALGQAPADDPDEFAMRPRQVGEIDLGDEAGTLQDDAGDQPGELAVAVALHRRPQERGDGARPRARA